MKSYLPFLFFLSAVCMVLAVGCQKEDVPGVASLPFQLRSAIDSANVDADTTFTGIMGLSDVALDTISPENQRLPLPYDRDTFAYAFFRSGETDTIVMVIEPAPRLYTNDRYYRYEYDNITIIYNTFPSSEIRPGGQLRIYL